MTHTARLALDGIRPEAWADWFQQQRWFGAKRRTIGEVSVTDLVALDAERVLALLSVGFAGSAAPTLYASVLRAVPVDERPCDAGRDNTVPRKLAEWMCASVPTPSNHGVKLCGWASDDFRQSAAANVPVKIIEGEQSNTSYVLGDNWTLKLLRKLHRGVHPEVQLLEFLGRVGFAYVPRLGGYLQLESHDMASTTLAVAQQFIANEGDCWTLVQRNLTTLLRGEQVAPEETIVLERLGGITGELHAALASDPKDPEFVPHTLTEGDVGRIATEANARLTAIEHASRLTRSPRREVDSSVERVLARRKEIVGAMEVVASRARSWGVKIRTHGDFHLGQVLKTGDDYVVIDFEGEPTRSLQERRERASPLSDLAGMCRSFSYAVHVASREHGSRDVEDRARGWERNARDAFLRGYLQSVAAAPASLVPKESDELRRALAFYELSKAIYEVGYELDHRPDWTEIPADGVEIALSVLFA